MAKVTQPRTEGSASQYDGKVQGSMYETDGSLGGAHHAEQQGYATDSLAPDVSPSWRFVAKPPVDGKDLINTPSPCS